MSTVGYVLMGVGGIVSLVWGIKFLIVAFKEHIGWGLGSLFVPGVGLVFLCMNFKIAAKPFFISIVGSVLATIGSVVAGAGAFADAGGMDAARELKGAYEAGVEISEGDVAPTELPSEAPAE